MELENMDEVRVERWWIQKFLQFECKMEEMWGETGVDMGQFSSNIFYLFLKIHVIPSTSYVRVRAKYCLEILPPLDKNQSKTLMWNQIGSKNWTFHESDSYLHPLILFEKLSLFQVMALPSSQHSNLIVYHVCFELGDKNLSIYSQIFIILWLLLPSNQWRSEISWMLFVNVENWNRECGPSIAPSNARWRNENGWTITTTTRFIIHQVIMNC